MDQRLILSLNDMTSLPNGTPLQVRVDGDKFSVGRHEDRDWVLPDPTRQISRHHFDIERIKGTFYLIDRSAMGTKLAQTDEFVNGPHALSDGDLLQIGQYRIYVQIGADQPSPEPVPDPSAIDPVVLHLDPGPKPGPAEAAAPPAAAASAAERPQSDEMLRAFCQAIGTSTEGTDPAEAGRRLAEGLRFLVTHLKELERHRRAVKPGPPEPPPGPLSPNPLQMDMSADETIAALFLRSGAGYMDSTESIDKVIETVTEHHRALAEAQLPAVAGLVRGLSPEDIAHAIDSGLFGNTNKSKAWDRYCETWSDKVRRADGRIIDVFRKLYTEAYLQALYSPAAQDRTRRGS